MELLAFCMECGMSEQGVVGFGGRILTHGLDNDSSIGESLALGDALGKDYIL